MPASRFLFLVVLFYPALGYPAKPWFIFIPIEQIWFITLVSLSVGIFLLIQGVQTTLQKFSGKQSFLYLFSALFVLAFLLFPVRTTSLGDGIGIHENVALEVGFLGYQLTMDEFLSAFFHSIVYRFFFSEPENAYRLVSTLAGFLFLVQLVRFFKQNQFGLSGFLLVIGSGGMLIFFGYVENYSLTTLLLSTILLKGYSIDKDKQKTNLLSITVLSATAVLFHLVSGYIFFALVYLCYRTSKGTRHFVIRSLFYGALGLAIIALPFFYFLFFADSRFELSLTHIAHPPFYPIRRILSTNHLKEILSCMFFSVGLSFLVILYSLVYKRRLLFDFGKQNLFLFWGIVGFILHAFLFNPLLGFPSDWDVMTIYWFPISIFTAIFVHQTFTELEKISILPLSIFFVLILFFHSFHFSKRTPLESHELNFTLETVKEYIALKKTDFAIVKPEDKKYYLRIAYFLFKTQKELDTRFKNHEKYNQFSGVGHSFQKELDQKMSEGFTKLWKKDYLQRLTDFHTEYYQLKKTYPLKIKGE
jgi:hypothetical protein